MVRIQTELAETAEPEEGKTYTIVNVEAIKTAIQGYEGYRVTMKRKGDDKEYATVLWTRGRASASSKLGSFMAAFLEFYEGDADKAFETQNWIGHKVRLISWKPRNREVHVVA